MTNEERQKLITDLKAARPGYPPGELCLKAADEIERLAALAALTPILPREHQDPSKWVSREDMEQAFKRVEQKEAADEIEQLEADRMNAAYQRDQALIELNGLTERVDQLEAQVTALSRM